jgi:hypothetical protein
MCSEISNTVRSDNVLRSNDRCKIKILSFVPGTTWIQVLIGLTEKQLSTTCDTKVCEEMKWCTKSSNEAANIFLKWLDNPSLTTITTTTYPSKAVQSTLPPPPLKCWWKSFEKLSVGWIQLSSGLVSTVAKKWTNRVRFKQNEGASKRESKIEKRSRVSLIKALFSA